MRTTSSFTTRTWRTSTPWVMSSGSDTVRSAAFAGPASVATAATAAMAAIATPATTARRARKEVVRTGFMGSPGGAGTRIVRVRCGPLGTHCEDATCSRKVAFRIRLACASAPASGGQRVQLEVPRSRDEVEAEGGDPHADHDDRDL